MTGGCLCHILPKRRTMQAPCTSRKKLYRKSELPRRPLPHWHGRDPYRILGLENKRKHVGSTCQWSWWYSLRHQPTQSFVSIRSMTSPTFFSGVVSSSGSPTSKPSSKAITDCTMSH